MYAIASYYQKNISYYRSDPSVNQGLMAVTSGYEIVLYYLFALLCAATALIIALVKKGERTKRYLTILFFGIMWVVVLGGAISPQGRFFLAPESRYLYLGSFGVLLILGSLYALLQSIAYPYRLTKVAFVSVTMVYVIFWSSYSLKYCV